MTLRPFAIGQPVLVRGALIAARADSAIVRFPTAKLGAEFPLEILTSNIFFGPSTDEACAAMHLFMERLDRLRTDGLRLHAEICAAAALAKTPELAGTFVLDNPR